MNEALSGERASTRNSRAAMDTHRTSCHVMSVEEREISTVSVPWTEPTLMVSNAGDSIVL